jgi:hypothetical protein
MKGTKPFPTVSGERITSASAVRSRAVTAGSGIRGRFRSPPDLQMYGDLTRRYRATIRQPARSRDEAAFEGWVPTGICSAKSHCVLLVLSLLGFLVPDGAKASVFFGYDPLGRLTTALYDNGLCIVDAYDANGNFTSQINYPAPPPTRAQWGSPSWGSFTWTSAPQWPIWGVGTWGCLLWTP